ncbi:fumarylacetoacetate hydrolase family protein [Glycocaulis abyssi]|uniref:Fumarylacetoacetate hydrolase family protein n=1 Tax=Glycocaulis abyssi TaxID=1433403 RepID=A0ABV9NEI1_9PROT
MTLVFEPRPPVLAPVADGKRFPVQRLFCVGRNYADHAREMGADPDREPPFFFTAWAETVVTGGGTIAYPQKTSNYHYEAELVVAIGKGGRNIPAESAMEHVYGYAAGLDMTRRDFQADAKAHGRPWDTAKNVEQSKPLGLIRTASDGFDPAKGRISLSVNGAVRQDADLSDMIWPVADVIAYLSGLYRIEPGDLIYTGTPAGVGAVVPGDVIEVAIDGLAPLNVTVGEPSGH